MWAGMTPEAREAYEAATAPRTDAPEAPWPEPRELVATLPEFPIDVLPGWLSRWALELATETQTPIDMAGMLGLVVVGATAAGRYRVHVRGLWFELLSLYVLVALPPGERKSAVYSAATRALYAYERERAAELAPEIARAMSAAKIAQGIRDRAEKIAIAKPSAETRRVAEEAAEAARAAEAEIPIVPRVVTGDASQEAVAELLDRHGGRIAVMDGEGVGPIANMLGRYATGGSVQVDMYLRGHGGDPIRVDRRTKPPLSIDKPAITLGLTIQPAVLEQLGARTELRGLGLLARMLCILPVSRVGEREVSPPPMQPQTDEVYGAQIRRLLRDGEGIAEPREIALAPRALALVEHFLARVEPRLGPRGDLARMADWAGKLVGAAVRIAGIMHVAEHVADPLAEPLSEETMARAIHLAEDYLLPHAQRALGVMAEGDPLVGARELLRRLESGNLDVPLARRDLTRHRSRPLDDDATIDAAIRALERHGWIVPRRHASSLRGGRPSPTWDVHPDLLARRPV